MYFTISPNVTDLSVVAQAFHAVVYILRPTSSVQE